MSQTLSKGDWYEIRALADDSAQIDLYGDIGDDWQAETLAATGFVKAVADLGTRALSVRINSYGGSVPDGLAIFNALKRHPGEVTTTNDGIAASIASLIFMAGDKRLMAANAQFMVHAPWTYMAGNSAELREMADQLDKWAKGMAASYGASGLDDKEILGLIKKKKNHWFSSQEALDQGFAP